MTVLMDLDVKKKRAICYSFKLNKCVIVNRQQAIQAK
jgi:hypothetical protein